jgi:hypothetical protein
MRIESSITSISWIPSEAVEGLPKLPFTFGVAHYDDPPPDRVDHIETMHRADLFREANELKAWVEVEGGTIVDYGHAGRGRIGLTRLKLGPKEIAVPAVAMPTLQDTEVGDGWVRFTQTAGGRTGMPAPRSVRASRTSRSIPPSRGRLWPSRFAQMERRSTNWPVPAPSLVIGFTTAKVSSFRRAA